MFTVQSLHISLEIWGSIFCMIMALCVYLNHGFERKKRGLLFSMQVTCSILLIADALTWVFLGYPGKLGYYGIRISHFFLFVITDMMLILFHRYLIDCIFGNGSADGNRPQGRDEGQTNQIPRWSDLTYVFGIAAILLVIVSQFTNLYDYFNADYFYHRNRLYPISMLVLVAGMITDLCLMIRFRKNMRRKIFLSMLSYVILPIAAGIGLMFLYGISLVSIAISISLTFLFMMEIMEQGRELILKKEQMDDLQTEILLSQIRPHFVYNTLTIIKHLCKKDPQTAAETIDEFARYLRGNLDSLTGSKKILFSQEFNHVKSYLAIEQKRFGKRIQVDYDIQEADFFVPVLTLQPIVENAVKHGIMSREQGGTIRISTGRYDTGYWIAVEDDGVGYLPQTKKETKNRDQIVHAGLSNVTRRVESMCGGYALEAFGIFASGYLMKPLRKEDVEQAIQNLRYPIAYPKGKLRVQCFGKFEVFYDGEPVAFARAKAKEIFAYLVDLNGASANTGELCGILWEDSVDLEKNRHYLRNLISDLRKSLRSCHAEDVFLCRRNQFAVDTEKIECDYYRFLKRDALAVNSYRGEYMKQYSWAEFSMNQFR